jgi:hypothetical protein
MITVMTNDRTMSCDTLPGKISTDVFIAIFASVHMLIKIIVGTQAEAGDYVLLLVIHNERTVVLAQVDQVYKWSIPNLVH